MKKLFVILFVCLAFAGSAVAATVDLNRATQAQLETVKGVGPVKAKAIIDYRAKNGPFKRVDDLEKVQGFGKKTVDSVRPQVSVGAAAVATDSKVKPAEQADAKVKPAEKKESKKVSAK